MSDIKYTNIRDIEYQSDNVGTLEEEWWYRLPSEGGWSSPFIYEADCRRSAISALETEETAAYEKRLFDAGFVRVACADTQKRYLARGESGFNLIVIDTEAVEARTVLEAEIDFFTIADSNLQQHDGIAILDTFDADGMVSHECALVPRTAGSQVGITYYRNAPFYTDDDRIGLKHLGVEIVAEKCGIELGASAAVMSR